VDRSVTINTPDDTSPMGIKTVEKGYVGPTAEGYEYTETCAG
jgi:hypothetical protein